MFSLNVNNEDVFLKDVKLNKLIKIHKWYNNIEEYGFATGVDKPMPFDYILKEYFKVVSSPEEFFVGVYNLSNEMVGLLKGKFILRKKIVWIKVLIIKTEFQRKGYGKKAIELLRDYFIKKHHVKSIYLTVDKENKGAYAFWKKQGFKEVEKIEKYVSLQEKNIKLLVLC